MEGPSCLYWGRADAVGTDGVLVSLLAFKTKWAAWCVAGRINSDTFPPLI
jgi:hypothetical protein